MSYGAQSTMTACRTFVSTTPADGAAFTVMSSDALRDTLCASDELIAEIEALQFALGEGPVLDAFTTSRPVLIPDLFAPRVALRWPGFTAEVTKLPVGGLFAFPMQLGAIIVGVCDLYRRQPGPIHVPELKLVLRAVDAATLSLLSLRAGERVGDLAAESLDEDGTSQRRVHQATGMLIVQLGVTAEVALARLRAHAYAEESSIDQIAEDIVARRLRLEPDPK